MKKEHLNITLVISSLHGGGAERVLSIMARYWAEAGHQISVITLNQQREDAYDLPSAIKRIRLDLSLESQTLWQGVKHNFNRFWQLRKSIDAAAPDIVIAFMDQTNILTLLASVGRTYKTIVTEHNNPNTPQTHDANNQDKIWSFLRRKLYPRAAKVVSVSSGIDKDFAWLSSYKRQVIHNPIVTPELLEKAKQSPTHPWVTNRDVPVFLALGRLARQKGFDYLLQAFQQVVAQQPARLIIGGKGPLQKDMENMVNDLDLRSHVDLAGFIENPYALLSQVDYYVLSSRWEGLPTVLIEAMACGCPVISFDCPYGPKEIIGDSGAGVLLPPEDVDALRDAMLEVLCDPVKRTEMALNTIKVKKRFTIEKIMEQWDDLVFNSLSS